MIKERGCQFARTTSHFCGEKVTLEVAKNEYRSLLGRHYLPTAVKLGDRKISLKKFSNLQVGGESEEKEEEKCLPSRSTLPKVSLPSSQIFICPQELKSCESWGIFSNQDREERGSSKSIYVFLFEETES